MEAVKLLQDWNLIYSSESKAAFLFEEIYRRSLAKPSATANALSAGRFSTGCGTNLSVFRFLRQFRLYHAGGKIFMVWTAITHGFYIGLL